MKVIFFVLLAAVLVCSAVYAQVSCARCDRMERQDRLACCNAGINKEQCCFNYVLPNSGVYTAPQYPGHSGGPGGYHGVGYQGGVGYPHPGHPSGPGYPYPNQPQYYRPGGY